jgi:hypothetical protein
MHATRSEALRHAGSILAEGEVRAITCKQCSTIALEEAIRIIERAQVAYEERTAHTSAKPD